MTFIATKLVAFAGRGSGDPIGSKDLEDITNLLASDPALAEQLARGETEVDHFIRD